MLLCAADSMRTLTHGPWLTINMHGILLALSHCFSSVLAGMATFPPPVKAAHTRLLICVVQQVVVLLVVPRSVSLHAALTFFFSRMGEPIVRASRSVSCTPFAAAPWPALCTPCCSIAISSC